MRFAAHRISRIVITNIFCTNETIRKLQAWRSGLFSKLKNNNKVTEFKVYCYNGIINYVLRANLICCG